MPITVTVKRAAEESGLSQRALQYAIADGRLKSVQIGRRRLIPVRSLEDFLLRGKGDTARDAQPSPSAGYAAEAPASGRERARAGASRG